jgi:hypothetical protein
MEATQNIAVVGLRGISHSSVRKKVPDYPDIPSNSMQAVAIYG